MTNCSPASTVTKPKAISRGLRSLSELPTEGDLVAPEISETEEPDDEPVVEQSEIRNPDDE
jgi:hypothetical protein